MRRIQEIEIELPQIVLERADAAYAQIRQQAAQESPAGRRVKSFPRVAGILLAVVILSATAVSPLPSESLVTVGTWRSA